MLNYISFCISAAFCGIFLPKPDVVIASSPQLLVGLSGLIIAKCKNVPFVFEVRDLWPESLEAVGASGRGSVLFLILRKLAAVLYKHAKRIVVVTHSFKDHLEKNWQIPSTKISVVVNGVDQHFFSPADRDIEIINEFGLKDRFVVGYIGTIGNAHGIETLAEAARILARSNPDIYFLVIGEGADKEKLQHLSDRKQLSNVGIFPGQPRSRVPSIIAATDLCLVLLRNAELFRTVIPTKVLEFMSCGRALVAAVDGEARHLISEAKAGVCVCPGDARSVAQAIVSLKEQRDLRARFGAAARSFVVNQLTRERTADQYLSILAGVLEDAGDGLTQFPAQHTVLE